MKRSIWELAAEAQAEVEKWPEWKRRVAEQALVSPLPRRPRTRTSMATHTDPRLQAEQTAMARERNRIVAYLQDWAQNYGDPRGQAFADCIQSADHWLRWDDLDKDGQLRPGKAPGAP